RRDRDVRRAALRPAGPGRDRPHRRQDQRLQLRPVLLHHPAGRRAGEEGQVVQVPPRLMPGGTCEATVYDVYGFTAASICVALGNYHNMDTAKRRIGPEFIDVADWRNMVKLF